jgi:hypothetical protein
MHALACSATIHERHPWLATSSQGVVTAKRLRRLTFELASRSDCLWIALHGVTSELMGEDFWLYGAEANGTRSK